MAREVRRPYFHSLPSEYRTLANEARLGPAPQAYPFSSYYRPTTIINLLRQWVDGTLPESCPIRPLNIYHYPPIALLEHYNGNIEFTRPSTDIKPIWFFTHLVKNPFDSEPKRIIIHGHEDGHWIKQYGNSKEIKTANNTTVGFMQKAVYYSSHHSDTCYKTEHRMEEYTLANYPEGTRGGISDTKCGEWMVVRLSVVRQRDRDACRIHLPRSRTRSAERAGASQS